MEEMVSSTKRSYSKQLRCIDVSKKVSAVFFTAAAVICAAAAGAAANAAPKRAAAAGAVSILFGAIGKWIHSLLNKRESAVRKHKEVTELMIMGAKFGMKDLTSIRMVALSLSETADDAAAVKWNFEDLIEKVDDYGDEVG